MRAEETEVEMSRRNRINLLLVVAVIGFVAVVAVVKESGKAAGSRGGGDFDGTGEPVPRLLDLGSTACATCKRLAPILDELRKEYAGRVRIDFLDVFEAEEDPFEKYRISLIPTLIFFDRDGEEVRRHEGFLSRKEIVAQFETMGIER
jgi:thioredoxin 1